MTRNEELFARTLVGNDVAKYALGVAIGGRRVDELTTGFYERPHNLRCAGPGLLVFAVKHIGGAKADRGNALFRARDGAGDRQCRVVLR